MTNHLLIFKLRNNKYFIWISANFYGGLNLKVLHPITKVFHPTTQKWPKVKLFHNFFYVKTCFLRKNPAFSGNKTLHQHFGANLKNPFFVKNLQQISYFLHFFSFLAQTTLKMHISTSVWSAQHPNACQNIPHLCSRTFHQMNSNIIWHEHKSPDTLQSLQLHYLNCNMNQINWFLWCMIHLYMSVTF